MKILYISPEHVSGTLSLFQEEHRRRGDECRFITFWHSRWDFPDDICLNLRFMPNKSWVKNIRNYFLQWRSQDSSHNNSKPTPIWKPSIVEKSLFAIRDQINWPIISKAIKDYDLESYDIIHLDGGLDFTRDGRFAKKMKSKGKRIVSFSHGSDLRNRGIIQAVDPFVDLFLTSEWDLLELDSRLKYLYLPFQTEKHKDRNYKFHYPIKICHASRNEYKGTKFVLKAVEELKSKYNIELIILENAPYDQALKIKNDSDIFVDQLTNEGGWGYGMSSVEALSMGLPVLTNIPTIMQNKIGDNPFIQTAPETIKSELEKLIQNESMCRDISNKSQVWVRQRHDVKTVADQLYSYYQELGWMKKN